MKPYSKIRNLIFQKAITKQKIKPDLKTQFLRNKNIDKWLMVLLTAVIAFSTYKNTETTKAVLYQSQKSLKEYQRQNNLFQKSINISDSLLKMQEYAFQKQKRPIISCVMEIVHSEYISDNDSLYHIILNLNNLGNEMGLEIIPILGFFNSEISLQNAHFQKHVTSYTTWLQPKQKDGPIFNKSIKFLKKHPFTIYGCKYKDTFNNTYSFIMSGKIIIDYLPNKKGVVVWFKPIKYLK